METNKDIYKIKGGIVFLNFLWGMETKDMARSTRNEQWFLNFLWGMETFFIIITV